LSDATWFLLAIGGPESDEPKRFVVVPVEPREELVAAFLSSKMPWAIPLVIEAVGESGSDAGRASSDEVAGEVLLGGFAVEVDATLVDRDEERPASAGPAGWIKTSRRTGWILRSSW
jgi:hypothetical protein